MQERNRQKRALRCCDLIFLRILPTAFLLVLTIRNVMAWFSFSGTVGAFFLRQLFSDTFPMVCLFLGIASVADFFGGTSKAAAVFRYLSAGIALLHIILTGIYIAVYTSEAVPLSNNNNIESLLCSIACIPIAVSCTLGDKYHKVRTILDAIATLLLLIAGAVFPLWSNISIPLWSNISNGSFSTEYITASLRYVLNTLLSRYVLNTLISGFCFLAPVFTGLVHRCKE